MSEKVLKRGSTLETGAVNAADADSTFAFDKFGCRSGSDAEGSAVSLGNGFFLTASHVVRSNSGKPVTDLEISPRRGLSHSMGSNDGDLSDIFEPVDEIGLKVRFAPIGDKLNIA